MSDQFDDKLVRMANQIARNLATDADTEEVATRVCDHINRFWSPLMKQEIARHLLNHGGQGLEPATLRAVEKLVG